jgi:hypothetical protein
VSRCLRGCRFSLTPPQAPMPPQQQQQPQGGTTPSPLQTSLPPLSQLEAVAEGEYPPLSPMSFYRPGDDD